jgi:hypothetical protein
MRFIIFTIETKNSEECKRLHFGSLHPSHCEEHFQEVVVQHFFCYKHVRFVLLLLFVDLVSSGLLVYGQATSASLTGQVTDPVGAVVTGATVTVTNIDTNFKQSAKTNNVGIYLLRPLPIGNYTLAIDATGFNRYIQKGIVLTVGLAATQNVTLKVGSGKTETVSVTADAELINTSTAELGTTVGEAAIAQLPLNGRDPSSLVLLAPGTSNVKQHGGEGVQTGFSFDSEQGASSNGGRQGSTFYMLDGVSNMDNYNLLTAPFPNSDATQEFKVISNNFSAQYGFSPGAVVSIATKSGTNSFHGGLFWFVRNNDLNASDWFSKDVDPLKRNQFGGFLGGPIKRNKLFFFGNYQGTRLVTAATNLKTNTPTSAMLEGDFSGLASTAGVTNLKGPFHTVNGVANQLDTDVASLNAAAVTITETGLPGHSSSATQAADGEMYYKMAATRNHLDEYTGKIDYELSPTQRLSLRSFTDYMTAPSSDTPGNMLSVLNDVTWSAGLQEKMYYFNDALTHTWTINPSTVNALSLFWNEQSAHNKAAVLDSNNEAMCLSRYINVTEIPNSCYMEGFTVTGNSNNIRGGWTEPSQEVRNTYGLTDTVSKILSNHTITTGIQLMHQYAEEYTEYPTHPEVTFTGAYTGNGMVDFLLGYMEEFKQGAGEIANVAGWQFAPFLQDDWKVRPNLTFNLGLRWDPNFAPTSKGGRGAAFVAGQQSLVFPNAPTGLIFPGDDGMKSTLMPNSTGYWEPRLGMVWQPKNLPHTVIHAGFGMFTGPLEYSSYNHSADIAPFSPLYDFYGSSCSSAGCTAGADAAITDALNFSDPWASTNAPVSSSPFPPFASVSYKPSVSATFNGKPTLGQSFSRDFKLGMTQSWNLSIEQQISQSMVARLAYVGSESYHQSIAVDLNAAVKRTSGTCTTSSSDYNSEAGGCYARPYTGFNQLLENKSNATASYNSLQAGIERHMSHGLQFQSNFTWSKTIDVASTSNVSFGSPYLGNPFNMKWNRGNSTMSVPWNWVTNFIYQAPRFRDKSKMVQEILGGWELSSIITYQSGNPFTIFSGGSAWGQDDSGSLQKLDRADRVAGEKLNVGKGSHMNWKTAYFNTSAFTNNAAGTFGDSAKNLMFGPREFGTDASIMKTWELAKGTNLQFRWEAFNATNHPSFANPSGDYGNTVGWGNFGKIGGVGNIAPRIMQGALKLTF